MTAALKTVMVVDDDDMLRETVCESLQYDGYRTVAVENGSTALAELRREPRKPDLILLDLMMPVMNGWQFREVQLTDPNLANIPIVVMTASRDTRGIRATEVLHKPVRLDTLLDTVARLTNGATELRSREAPVDLAATTRDPASASPFEAAFEAADLSAYGLLMQAPVPVAVLIGPQHVCTLANPAYREVAGREVLGKAIRATYPELPHDAPMFRMLDEIYRTGRTVEHVEYPVMLVRDGTESPKPGYFNFTTQALRDSGGSIVGIMAIGVDVTTQVLTRRSVEESEGQVRRLVNHVRAGIAETDLTGKFTFTNERYRELVGRSESELEHQGILDITHPEDREKNVGQFRALVEHGAPFIVEKRYVRPDGSIVWVRSSLARIDDREGRPQRLAAVTVDITQRVFAEQAMRESEERFRNMADNAPVMIWVTDPDGRRTYLSKPWYEFTGQQPPAKVGEPPTAVEEDWFETIHPDERALVRRVFDASSARREAFQLEYRLRRKDGVYRWTMDSASPRLGPDREFLGYVGSVIDITDRKAVELALKESEERNLIFLQRETSMRKEVESLYRIVESFTEAQLDLETIVQRLTDHGTELIGAKYGAFVYKVVNESGGTELRYTNSGAPKEAFSTFGLPPDTPLFDHTFGGKGVVRLDDVTNDSRYGKMAPHYGLPKEHLPVKSYLAVPVTSQTGEVVGALLFGHPEPARFTAQHERMVVAIAQNAAIAMDNARLYRSARTSEARYRTMFETASVALLQADCTELKRFVDELTAVHGSNLAPFLREHPEVVQSAVPGVTVLRVNPAAVRLYGADDADALLQSFPKIFASEAASAFFDTMVAIAERRPVVAAEARSPTLRESSIDVTFTAPLPNGNEGWNNIIVSVVDVTAEKTAHREREARLEEMKRALRFSDTFVGILGHDLRNPLSAITTAAGLLESRADSEKIARPLRRILVSADRMERMISQLLDLTRIRLGRGLPLERASVDLSAIALSTIEELAPVYKRDIRLEVDGNVEGMWDGDRLSQLLSNLVANACQHGTSRTAVYIALDGTTTDHVRLEVRNRGTIPPDFLPVIFEPLRSGERNDKRERTSGLGLGLYITREVVLAHGGTIRVASNDEDGTTFVVELPRQLRSVEHPES